MRVKNISFVFAILSIANISFGWSFKEHIMFARLAALRLENDPKTPPEMVAWLKAAAPGVPDMAGEEDYFMHTHIGADPQGMAGISYWAFMPDVHAMNDKDVKIAPFDLPEAKLHFIDLEIFAPGGKQREYTTDLSTKPQVGDIRRVMSDARYIQSGMLPFRIEWCYNNLVQSIRDKKMNAPTTQEQEMKTATYWAGYLAHYLADNTQPQHATIDYKSKVYFANKQKAPNVHSQVEYVMCDDEKNDYMDLRKEYWPLFVKYMDEFQDPVTTDDPWLASVETSLQSYDALPMIGVAAMKAAGQGGTPEHPTGDITGDFDTVTFFHAHGTYMGRDMSVLEMKAIQTAWAVRRIQRFWLQAWNEGFVTLSQQ